MKETSLELSQTQKAYRYVLREMLQMELALAEVLERAEKAEAKNAELNAECESLCEITGRLETEVCQHRQERIGLAPSLAEELAVMRSELAALRAREAPESAWARGWLLGRGQLVTDEPAATKSKPWDESMRRNCVPLGTKSDRAGCTCSWPKGIAWPVVDANCPQHGASRPGQGKPDPTPHPAVAMANEAIRRENAKRICGWDGYDGRDESCKAHSTGDAKGTK